MLVFLLILNNQILKSDLIPHMPATYTLFTILQTKRIINSDKTIYLIIMCIEQLKSFIYYALTMCHIDRLKISSKISDV